jgi:hypothetical protein
MGLNEKPPLFSKLKIVHFVLNKVTIKNLGAIAKLLGIYKMARI